MPGGAEFAGPENDGPNRSSGSGKRLLLFWRKFFHWCTQQQIYRHKMRFFLLQSNVEYHI